LLEYVQMLYSEMFQATFQFSTGFGKRDNLVLQFNSKMSSTVRKKKYEQKFDAKRVQFQTAGPFTEKMGAATLLMSSSWT